MTELNKNSFFFYFLKKTGGLYDPALVTKMIEVLKEWLPENSPDIDKDDMDAYELGQREYKDFIMENLK